MAPKRVTDDTEWKEADINSYAVFMGYLSMAVRGLGFLVVTWTTVVLLGGFVSTLKRKDFDLVSHRDCPHRDSWHDYTDGESNMRPALDVLYSLALFQGVLFGCRASYSSAGKKIVEKVVKAYGVDDRERPSISDYLEDTMAGCEKDPTFARGRNLVTYAVELMESRSPDGFLSGARILDAVIRSQSSSATATSEEEYQLVITSKMYLEQHMVIKSKIDSASTSHVLHKLLQALDLRSPCNRETRERAARIVAYLAGDIRLEQFPRGIEYISCLIAGTFEDYRLLEPYERDWLLEKWGQDWFQRARHLPSREDNFSKDLWEEYEELLLQGQRILGKLAANEKNCRFMGDTQGLLSKIMAPLTSDLLHNANHSTWYRVVDGSLQVVHQLVSAPGETGVKLRRQISRSSEATRTMERILTCTTCETDLQQRAMEIITRLDIIDIQSTQGFIKKLLDIFTGANKKDDTTRPAAGESELSPEAQKKKDDGTTRLAGEALAKLVFQGGSNIATIILRVHDDNVVTSLSEMLLDAKVPITPRISAAEILQHLCVHYTNNDDCLQKLKEAMTDVMPKVLSGIRLPKEHGDASQDDGRSKSASSRKEAHTGRQNSKLRSALLYLCLTVFDTFISDDPDQRDRLYATDAFSGLPGKLKKMVERNSKPTIESLTWLKLTSKMVISVTKHSGSSYLKQEDLDSLMEALESASKIMDPIDSSMYFASADNGATTTSPVRSLASLVKEAKETVATTYCQPQELELMDPSTFFSNGNPE